MCYATGGVERRELSRVTISSDSAFANRFCRQWTARSCHQRACPHRHVVPSPCFYNMPTRQRAPGSAEADTAPCSHPGAWTTATGRLRLARARRHGEAHTGWGRQPVALAIATQIYYDKKGMCRTITPPS